MLHRKKFPIYSRRFLTLKPKEMTLNIVTFEDLDRLRKELVEEIKKLLVIHEKAPRLIKGRAVCKMLNMSPGKLKAMRDKKKIEYVVLGHAILYEFKHILDLIEKNKKNKGLHCFIYGLLSIANMEELIM